MTDNQNQIQNFVVSECIQIVDQCITSSKISNEILTVGEIWNKLFLNENFKKMSHLVKSDMNLSGYDFVMVSILRIMGDRGINQLPKINLHFSKEILDDNGSVLILGLHNGVALSAKVMSDFNKKFSIMTDFPDDMRRLLRYSGVSNEVESFERDKYSLVKIKNIMRNGKSVICTVDFRDWSTGLFKFISPALFVFSEKIKAPVFFTSNKVDSSGNINYFLEGPYYGPHETLLSNFFEFLGRFYPNTEFKSKRFDYKSDWIGIENTFGIKHPRSILFHIASPYKIINVSIKYSIFNAGHIYFSGIKFKPQHKEPSHKKDETSNHD